MSGFEIRGFIEGFYGRVWSDEKRRRVLKLAAENGMNSYFYSPKDDPFLRQRWRSEYDSESLKKFSSLFHYTEDIGVSLYYCLSPGLDMAYSSDEDFETLMNKFNSIYNIGVRNFGLFLDDIPDKLVHDGDIDRFESVCEAHIYLINRVYGALPKDCELVICPMQYNGNGTEPFITGLCHGIPDAVSVFWTGKKICSPELTGEDAQKFIDGTGRKPLYWDNFPVNDAEMYGEMHIGPYLKRSADLHRYSRGIVANVMEYPLCSAIPLLTICDYLSDPEGYEPESSFRRAAEAVTGDRYEDWMPFFDHTRFSCQCDCFSEYLSDYLSDVKSEFSQNNNKKACDMLEDLISTYKSCYETMKRNTEMYDELKKWADRFYEIIIILKNAESYIDSMADSDREILLKSMRDYNLNAYKLAGFGLREFVENITGEFTI